MRDALNSALDEEMGADPKVFIIGEEVRLSFHSNVPPGNDPYILRQLRFAAHEIRIAACHQRNDWFELVPAIIYAISWALGFRSANIKGRTR